MIFLKIYYHIIAFIKKIFYKIIYGKHIKFGKKVTFRRGFSLVIEDGATVEIGDGCFFNNYCSINAKKRIKIGNNCLFGESVKLYDHDHDYTNNIKEFISKEIIIGDDSWIASNCVILKGVKIGKNTVVAAGTVLNKSIESEILVCEKRDLKLREIKR